MLLLQLHHVHGIGVGLQTFHKPRNSIGEVSCAPQTFVLPFSSATRIVQNRSNGDVVFSYRPSHLHNPLLYTGPPTSTTHFCIYSPPNSSRFFVRPLVPIQTWTHFCIYRPSKQFSFLRQALVPIQTCVRELPIRNRTEGTARSGRVSEQYLYLSSLNCLIESGWRVDSSLQYPMNSIVHT
jgi:hypothetical protein